MVSDQHEHNLSDRKKDHIELAFASQMQNGSIDDRFFYEPMLAAHPVDEATMPFGFEDKQLHFPIWISSMTGGTKEAARINKNLARVCGEFGFGMGLGSCRILLDSEEYLDDFNVREKIGDNFPLYANLGVAQVENLLTDNSAWKIDRLIEKLDADGLIVHVNPLQEWLQPEGDRFRRPPIITITDLLGVVDYPVIVKEVGQGIGRASLEALLKLPLAAVEFAAHGGTNFSKLELLRNDEAKLDSYADIARVGHDADTMVDMVNAIQVSLGKDLLCRHVIVSGGVRNFLDGYYYTRRLNVPAMYGQASAFLKYAREDYAQLREFAKLQVEGLKLANAFLRVKTNDGPDK